MTTPLPNERFRNRLLAGDLLLGTMLKTPTVHATEILAAAGFDFLAIDAEHSPFDARDLDSMALAAHAAGIATLVRVADASPSRLLAALDLGFAGVIVPHISSAAAAREIVAACRFTGGHRGFASSPRSARYGALAMADVINLADRSTTVIAMIEDPEGVANADAILAVPGIDAILIGRADLTIALGERSSNAPAVVAAVTRVLAAARAAGKRAMLYLGDPAEAPAFIDQSATLFLAASDQSILRSAALAIRTRFTNDFCASRQT